MRRAAFTLIEVMVAIALALLLSGLVLAVTMSRVAEAAASEAIGQVSGAMGLARAEAQRRGRVVEVEAREGGEASGAGWELVTLVWDGERAAAAPGDGAARRPDGMGEGVAPGPNKVEVDSIELPRGVKIEVDRGESMAEGSAAAGKLPDHTSRALSLAVFLPDGSGAMLSRRLVGGDGRAVRLSMNRWTGEVSGEAIVPTVHSGDLEPAP